MSLCFPISSAGKRGGGTALKEGLEEWWEDANDVGKHNSTTLTNISANSNTATNAPNGLNAWSRTTSAVCNGGTTNKANDFTLAFVNKKLSSGNYIELFRGDDQIQYRSGSTVWWDNLQYSGSTNKIVSNLVVRNVFQSIVATKVSGKAYLYINGILANPTGHTHTETNTTTYQMSYDNTQVTAVIAKWGRGFTQTDVDAFHNGGAFRTYADL